LLLKFYFVIIILEYERIGDNYMKAATGELNLTVITLLAISAVIAFFWLMWPSIKESINTQWNNLSTYHG
jgi:hypothetical protein